MRKAGDPPLLAVSVISWGGGGREGGREREEGGKEGGREEEREGEGGKKGGREKEGGREGGRREAMIPIPTWGGPELCTHEYEKFITMKTLTLARLCAACILAL